MCYHVYMISAHKRTCVDHRNMPNHHTSIYSYHVWVCVWMAAMKANCTKRICVLLEACNLYAPQGVDLGESGSLSYWHDKVKWLALAAYHCKVVWKIHSIRGSLYKNLTVYSLSVYRVINAQDANQFST